VNARVEVGTACWMCARAPMCITCLHVARAHALGLLFGFRRAFSLRLFGSAGAGKIAFIVAVSIRNESLLIERPFNPREASLQS
jgi:hypothetical protein